ncbi:MAG: copper resistance protein CopC [Aeromicrobium sp.]|uniref:copper resistance CopC family protein n=1 Tax=Aeromicrobium sp. TaxID=1871063 RepID=UPI003C59102F
MARRLAALALAVLALLVASPAVAADPAPLAMEPRVREELARPPSAVTMAFAWKIIPDSARIYVLDANGKSVTSGPPTVDTTNMTSQLEFDLPRGTYSVYYRANDRSNVLIGGAYQFSVGKGTWTKLDSPATWSGSPDQPSIFAGNNPNRPSADDEPAPTTTESPGVEIVTEDGTVLRPDQVSDDATGEASDSGLPWWWIAGGAVVAAVGVATALVVRRRSRELSETEHFVEGDDPV